MEDIIGRLDKINIQINMLEDTEREVFNEKICDNIVVLNEIVTKIENNLAEYDLPQDECNEIELNKKREKLILKQLFVCYWYIKEQINTMDANNLVELEEKLRSRHMRRQKDIAIGINNK